MESSGVGNSGAAVHPDQEDYERGYSEVSQIRKSLDKELAPKLSQAEPAQFPLRFSLEISDRILAFQGLRQEDMIPRIYGSYLLARFLRNLLAGIISPCWGLDKKSSRPDLKRRNSLSEGTSL